LRNGNSTGLTLATRGVTSLTNGLDRVVEFKALAVLIAVGGQFSKVSYVFVVSTVWRTPDARINDIVGQRVVLRFSGNAKDEGSSSENGSETHIGGYRLRRWRLSIMVSIGLSNISC
jgi:hypothetical protein